MGETVHVNHFNKGKLCSTKEIVPVTKEDRRKMGFQFLWVEVREAPSTSGL